MPTNQEHALEYNRQGITLANQGRLDEAAIFFRQALQFWPEFSAAQTNLGNIYFYQNQYDEAVACYQQALRLSPDDAGTYNNLGNCLCHQGRYTEAVAACRQAQQRAPNDAGVYSNLGNAFWSQGDLEQALASYRQAVRLKPDYAEAWTNLGLVLMESGDPSEAAACCRQALRYRPDSADAHCYLGMSYVLQGNFEQGWPEHEWRWRRAPLPPFRQPLWDGSALDGRTVLLVQEGGFGDVLHFIRYAPLVKERGGRVLVTCYESLIPLLAGSPDIDGLLPLGPTHPSDYFVMMQSLPFLFRTTLATIPANVPYLFVDPELVKRWGAVVDKETRRQGDKETEREGDKETRRQGDKETNGADSTTHHSPLTTHHSPLRIGIVWQANPQMGTDRDRQRSSLYRSIRLRQFAPLAGLPGVRLFSLQKGPGEEQLSEVAAGWPIANLGCEFESFADTAAAIKNLDLIITVDTAVAHCAGALGTPVWVALSTLHDWRWLQGRDDSPWYPTMRLFRQDKPGDWDGVIQRMAAEVRGCYLTL